MGSPAALHYTLRRRAGGQRATVRREGPGFPSILQEFANVSETTFSRPSIFLIGRFHAERGASLEPGNDRPNFIVINVDDLGYSDIEPYGSSDKTPALARMAKEGRKLTCHYAAPSVRPRVLP